MIHQRRFDISTIICYLLPPCLSLPGTYLSRCSASLPWAALSLISSFNFCSFWNPILVLTSSSLQYVAIYMCDCSGLHNATPSDYSQRLKVNSPNRVEICTRCQLGHCILVKQTKTAFNGGIRIKNSYLEKETGLRFIQIQHRKGMRIVTFFLFLTLILNKTAMENKDC